MIIGIKHGFSCIKIRQVPWDVLKTEGRGFQHLPRNLANVNALKKHVRSLLLHKNWKHLLHFALFLVLKFARSRGRCWNPKAAVFNTSQGTWRMLMHWKNMFDRYYCIKTENICYISRYFLFSPFHWCLANAISTDFARSRAGHYTSRDGSNSVAPVYAY